MTTGVPLHPELPADAFSIFHNAVPDLERVYLELIADFMDGGLPRPLQLRGERMLKSYEFGSEALSFTDAFDTAMGRSAKDKARKGAFFPPTVAWLAGLVTVKAGRVPDACIVQLYRTGDDHIDFHVDAPFATGPTADAPELYIFSFGAERSIGLRPLGDHQELEGEPRVACLPHGSLLRMAGEAHRTWEHSILKEPAQRHMRISVSFSWRQRSPIEEIPWMLAEGDGETGRPMFVGPEAEAVQALRELEAIDPTKDYTLASPDFRTFDSSHDYDAAISYGDPDEREGAVLRALRRCGDLIGRYPEYFDPVQLRASLPPSFLHDLRAELGLDLATPAGAKADHDFLETLKGIHDGPDFDDLPQVRKDYVLAAMAAMQWWIDEGNAGRHPRVPAFTARDGIILRWLEASNCEARTRLSILEAISYQLGRMLNEERDAT